MSASPNIVDRGMMLVVSSPSGAGKTTLTRLLLEAEQDITLSISVTTRQPRPGEKEGVDYKFVPQAEFDWLQKNGELLEWAIVHGNSYGTPRVPVESALAAGKDVLFDIDWQGTQQLKQSPLAPDVVTVFVLPPSIAELKRRLESRAQDRPDVIARRLRNAAEEIPHWVEYDYVLVNSDIDKSFLRLRSILQTERLKRVQSENVQALVDQLIADLKKLTD